MELKKAKLEGVKSISACDVQPGNYVWSEVTPFQLNPDLYLFGIVLHVFKEHGKIIIVTSHMIPDHGTIAWILQPDSAVWYQPRSARPICRDESLENRIDY